MRPAKMTNDEIRMTKKFCNDECPKRAELGTAKARIRFCGRRRIRPSSFVLRDSSFGLWENTVEQTVHYLAFMGELKHI